VRDLTTNMAAEIEANNLMPVLLAEFEFDSATLYMWSGTGTLTWDGNDYLGGGNLVSISTMEETQELQAKGIVCTLSGIPSTLIAAALLERTRGRPMRLWLGCIDPSSDDVRLLEDGGYRLLEDGSYRLLEEGHVPPNTLVEDPYRVFTGLMDVIEGSDNGEAALLRLSVESALIIGRRSKVARYTSEEQRKRYPTDRGLEFINQLQDKEVVW